MGPDALPNLLNFLGSSFGGGTDIVRPLKWAIGKLDPTMDAATSQKMMAPPSGSKMWSPKVVDAWSKAELEPNGSGAATDSDGSTDSDGPTDGASESRDVSSLPTPVQRRRSKQRDAVLTSMANADVLLVTDGELRMPPVGDDVMACLRRLANDKGVQVHGLLVGKSSSPPLETICR